MRIPICDPFAARNCPRGHAHHPTDNSGMSQHWFRKTALVWAFLVTTGPANVSASDLSGTVKDVCGLVIPGTVVVIGDSSGTTLRTLTNGEGRYSFANVPAGSWTATFELVGFEKHVERIQFVQANAVVTQDVRLITDFTGKETLTISHADPSVRYRRYSISGTVTGRGDEPIAGATITFSDVLATRT